MKYILLDINILKYQDGGKELSHDIQNISRLLLDSEEFKICIHPLSIIELRKCKDTQKLNAILSKVDMYNKLEKPPKITKDFELKCDHKSKNHDLIDNTLLYTVYKNRVSYLITNNEKILKKANKLELSNKVLTIAEAIKMLSHVEKSILIKNPPIVNEEYLYNIDTNDSFFCSLRNDYAGFDEWFIKKKYNHEKARVTYKENGKIGAFLMMKIEGESESYIDFDIPFNKAKRIKISTFKVEDNGKSIGEAFIKIVFDFALDNNINEIYVTIFDKHDRLIDLFMEYGFKFYTYKNTLRNNGSKEKEGVYLKIIETDKTNYPIIRLNDQSIYILSIQDEFANMLFPDLFDIHQVSIADLEGVSTYSNVIKKVYISKSKISSMKKDDILVFYISQIKKSISCVCVIDDVFKANEIESFEVFQKIVKRRTVYDDIYLKEAYRNGYLIILFKYYVNLPLHISLETAKNENILKAAPQSIQALNRDSFKKIVEISGSEKQIII